MIYEETVRAPRPTFFPPRTTILIDPATPPTAPFQLLSIAMNECRIPKGRESMTCSLSAGVTRSLNNDPTDFIRILGIDLRRSGSG